MFKLFAVTVAFAASLASAAPLDRRTSGTATYYAQGGAAGSCGTVHSDSDYIVALGSANDPSSNCGKSVSITSDSGSITATVADTCASCDSTHIDLSHAAFQALGDMSSGVLDVTWSIE